MCFGDSNTFGSNPSGGRWDRTKRWPGRLQQLLGEDYYVIEEGCGGRTTSFDDTLELDKNGRRALPVALATHKPLDLVIIMLGTNDMKHRFSALPCDVAYGAGELVQLVQRYPYGNAYPIPKVLLIAPIWLGEHIEDSPCTGFHMKLMLFPSSLRRGLKSRRRRMAVCFWMRRRLPGRAQKINCIWKKMDTGRWRKRLLH